MKELELNDDAGLEILVNLVKEGQIDPWNIDLEKVTTQYLRAINLNHNDSLKEAGRAIFYASVLLRMKSDLLLAQSEDALKIGLHAELDDNYLLEQELNSSTITQITFADLEAALRRKYIQKAKRFRKLSLSDLIQALQEARDEEDLRLVRQQQRLLDDDYNIVVPELGEDILDLTHAENLDQVIKKLENLLPEYLFDDRRISFGQVCQILGSWSNAFLALVFLAHESKIELIQEDFYGDLWISKSK